MSMDEPLALLVLSTTSTTSTEDTLWIDWFVLHVLFLRWLKFGSLSSRGGVFWPSFGIVSKVTSGRFWLLWQSTKNDQSPCTWGIMRAQKDTWEILGRIVAHLLYPKSPLILVEKEKLMSHIHQINISLCVIIRKFPIERSPQCNGYPCNDLIFPLLMLQLRKG